MNPEPRHEEEYTERQVEAAHRVLIDIAQVLASFRDCLVIVGGWAPDLLLEGAEEAHIGSIDVDIALDADKLNDGRYAEILKLLLDTGRYSKGEKDFQFVIDVDLKDGGTPVHVDVDFLAPKDAKLKRHAKKRFKDFRVLQVEACNVAFRAPEEVTLSGENVRGATNTVRVRVVSMQDFLVMKPYALDGRDKPKDAYDLCYSLEHAIGGMEAVAAAWRNRLGEKEIVTAIKILQEKFTDVNAFGPQQLVEFHASRDEDEQKRQARRAFELVQKFISLLQSN